MKVIISTLCAAVLALSPLASTAAAIAPTAFVGSETSGIRDLIRIQDRGDRDRSRGDAEWRRQFDNDDRNRNRSDRYDERRDDDDDNDGPDLGSAIVGAIVGGIIVNELQKSNNQRARAGFSGTLSRDHVAWCQNRWRSYRASDNSYQPNSGPRRACNSPF